MSAEDTPAQVPHILAADDEVASRIFLEQALILAGYRVTACRSGEEVLRQAAGQPPDLILLDALMPGLDGIATCQRLKQFEGTRHVPVLFLSGLQDPEEKLRAFEAGAVDFLIKPVDPAELRARVKTHLVLGRKWHSLAYRARSEGILLHELIHAIDDVLLIFQILRDESARVSDFEVAYANAQACKILAQKAENLVGQRRQQLGTLGTALKHEDLTAAVWAQRVVEHEIAVSDSAEERYFRLSIIPLENDLVAVFFRDITSFKRLQAERDANLKAALQTERMATLGTLAAGVGHEINNPNNVLTLNLPILETIWPQIAPVLRTAHERGELPTLAGLPTSEMLEEVPRLLGAMTRASQRIKQIVRLLRDYVRGGSSPGAVQNLQVNDVIHAALELVGPRLHKATQDFQIDLQDALPLVRGDAGRLEQAVINLLNNAAEALTDSSQKIILRSRLLDSGQAVEIYVQDRGAGMSPEVLARMRDPFFTTKHNCGGTGLGVAIVQRIAEEHAGTLEYQSKIGEGTTARLCLPVAPGK